MATKTLNYTAAEVNQRLNLAGTAVQPNVLNGYYTKTEVDGKVVVDLSTRYNTSYANLSAALAALNSDTATDASAIKKGGVSIKFINSSTNKYEQWNLKASSWSVNTSDWVKAVDSADIPINKIESGSTQSEEDAIIFETDGGVQVGKITASGADFANLKRGGQQVARMSDLPTKDNSIGENPSTTNVPTTKAVKDYVDANSGGDYPIETETTSLVTEEQVWGNDAETQEYVKIGSYGMKSKAYLDMEGNSIIEGEIGNTPSTTHAPSVKAVKDYVDEHGGIDTETTQEGIEEQVWGNNSETEAYVKIGSYGIKSKSFISLDSGLPLLPAVSAIPDNPDDTNVPTTKVVADGLFKTSKIAIVPPKVYVASGREMNVYYYNIINGDQAGNRYTCYNHLLSGYQALPDCFRFKPTDNSSEVQARINYGSFSNDTTTYNVQFKFTPIPSSVGSGLTKNVMFIGDSLTEQNVYPAEVKNLCAQDNLTLNLVGTLGTAYARHEGRGNWYAKAYVTMASFNGKTNAFWNPSTEKFDFSYYMTQNNFSSVDIVFINLGTNDIEGGRATEQETLDALDEMVASIHQFNINIKVVIWLPAIRSQLLAQPIWKLLMLNHIQAKVNHFGWNGANNVYLLPLYLGLDVMSDYKQEEDVICSRHDAGTYMKSDGTTANIAASGLTTQRVTDYTHPSVYGYLKIADMVFSFIKYLIS